MKRQKDARRNWLVKLMMKKSDVGFLFCSTIIKEGFVVVDDDWGGGEIRKRKREMESERKEIKCEISAQKKSWIALNQVTLEGGEGKRDGAVDGVYFFYYVCGIFLRLLKSFFLFQDHSMLGCKKIPLNFKMPTFAHTKICDEHRREARRQVLYLNFCLCCAAPPKPRTSSDDSPNFPRQKLQLQACE